jgi:thioredoxin 1
MKNLVIFKAHWCQPCKQLAKTIEGVDLGIPVNTVDIDADPTATTEFNIRGVPTLLLMEDMQVVKRKSGYMTAEQLKEFCA